jgi:hypothetical protein
MYVMFLALCIIYLRFILVLLPLDKVFQIASLVAWYQRI